MEFSSEDRITASNDCLSSPAGRAATGCLLGTAVGDAIGLPLENLSRRRIDRWLGDRPLRHRFLFGRGMVSDDTEHTCLVAQALVRSGGDPDRFGRGLAKRLRWWLAGLPAGTGRATARACMKLWLGADFKTSGVWSAGNGPPMRAAIIGTAIQQQDLAIELTRVSSQITHSDPKATYGSLAVAAVAHSAVHGNDGSTGQPLAPENVTRCCAAWIGDDDEAARELVALIETAAASAAAGESTRQYAANHSMQDGVSGYTYHTVPAALHACMRYPADFRAAIEELVRCGGDVDSTAAIAGGILGAAGGPDTIPPEWLDRLWEWPRTTGWMQGLAADLAALKPPQSGVPPTINPLFQFIRNLLFLLVVLVHAVRRLLPPW